MKFVLWRKLVIILLKFVQPDVFQESMVNQTVLQLVIMYFINFRLLTWAQRGIDKTVPSV